MNTDSSTKLTLGTGSGGESSDAVVRLKCTLTPKSYDVDNGAHALLIIRASIIT